MTTLAPKSVSLVWATPDAESLIVQMARVSCTKKAGGLHQPQELSNWFTSS